MRFYLNVLVLISLIGFAGAQDKLWTISGGINISSFCNLSDKSITRASFAISRDFPITEKYSITSGIMLSGQGSLLENKPIKTQDWELYLDAYDIKVQRVYLDIPVLVEYSLKFVPVNIKPYTGISYRIGLGDRTRTFNRKVIYDDDHPERKSEFENYKFEYRFGDFSHGNYPIWISSSGFVFNFGTKFEYKIIVIEFRYTFSLHHVGNIDQIEQLGTEKKQLQAFHILLGIKF